MCGIAGIVARGTLPREDVLAAMVGALAHRGPDAEGRRILAGRSASCALLHRRLAILDLSDAGIQPMSDPGGTAWVVLNGEIYNYLELREELRALPGGPHVFRTGTDTEVLLAAWQAWGEGMLPRLNGMFAFALWDTAREILFAARDRFGEKPFLYRAEPGIFAFGSEHKALCPLEDAGILPRAAVDDGFLYRFLQFGHLEHRAETMRRGVLRLPPGHQLTVRRDGDSLAVRVQRWYALPVAGGGARDDGADAAERYRALFDDAIRLRLRADVAVGTSLSGGVDSSAVVTSMAAALPAGAPQHAFTCRMEDPLLDEGALAREVAGVARARIHEIRPAADELARDFDRLAAFQEEPFGTASIYAQFRVFERARAEGITVLLDGQGADEVLGGYGTFAAVAAGESLAHGRLREARAFLESSPSNGRARTRREAREYALRARLPGFLLRLVESVRFPKGAHSAAFVADEARRRHGRPDRLRPDLSRPGWLGAMLRFSATEGSLQTLLRFADRNSMAHAREVRLPFLDHRLVELTLSLSDRWIVGEGFTKRVLREAMAGRIPDSVRLRREKIGFEAPDVLWFTGPLREWFRGRVDAALARFPDLVDAPRARAALDAIRPDHPGRHAAVAALFPWISAEAAVRAADRGFR